MGLKIKIRGTDYKRGHKYGKMGAPLTMNPWRLNSAEQSIRHNEFKRGWLAGRLERIEHIKT